MTRRRTGAFWSSARPSEPVHKLRRDVSTTARSLLDRFSQHGRVIVHPIHWLICAQVGYSDWDEVASYQSWSPLKSKGTLGGAYSYIDATVSEGEWLYRIVAEQSDNSRAIVCQVGVSVAVWKSTSEFGYCGNLRQSERHRADAEMEAISRRWLGIYTSSSRCSYGDDVASMAWGVRNDFHTGRWRTRASSSRRSWSSAASRRSCWARSRRARCWTRSRASSILSGKMFLSNSI